MSRAGTATATATAAVALAGLALAGCTPPEPATEQQSEPPVDKHELYGVLSRGIYEPMPYEGGNEDTCGAWAAQDPADAREMLAQCPPLTKGALP